MKKISSIRITNNYIEIKLDDKTSYKVSDDAYFEHKYKANMELDDQAVKQIQDLSNYHMAYMSALNKIKYKDRSEYEIRSHMYDDFNLIKPDVDKIIEKLKRYDFIDDERYTRDTIEKSRYKYHGYNKIKSSLIDVKIRSSIIDKYLINDFDIEFKLALEFSEKARRSIRNKNTIQIENTLKQKMLYRGFSNDVVFAVIQELHVEVDEDVEFKLLEKEFEKAHRRLIRRYEGYELRQRLFNSLRSKGFAFDQINEVLDGMENENE